MIIADLELAHARRAERRPFGAPICASPTGMFYAKLSEKNRKNVRLHGWLLERKREERERNQQEFTLKAGFSVLEAYIQ